MAFHQRQVSAAQLVVMLVSQCALTNMTACSVLCSLRSTLCLRYPPDVITVGIIALTIAHKKCAPPVRHNRAGEFAPPWHEELFNVDKATLDEIGMVTLDALEPPFCFEVYPIPQQNAAAASSSTSAASSTAASSSAAAAKPRASSTSTSSTAPQQHVSSQSKSAAPSVPSRLPPPPHHVPPTLPPGHNPHRRRNTLVVP